MNNLVKTALKPLLLSVIWLVLLVVVATNVQALSGSGFKAGRVIDDAVFYKSTSMSLSQIQSFLDRKVPTCDTNGTQTSEYGGGTDYNHDGRVTRAEYAKTVGWQSPPYTCLKNYKTKIYSRAADAFCASLASSGDTKKSAAEVIYRVSRACRISPKVMLTTLQKESAGPLITDTWPLNSQYNHPMGYNCPDSNVPSQYDANNNNCYDSTEGFFKQIYYAARQFQLYRVNANDYSYVAGRTNTILWHPNASLCGSSQVYISTQATAGLYNYTPYRPNPAALAHLYGTGDSCSSYGMRNFWRIYTDWFGSTLTTPIRVTVPDGKSGESGGRAKIEFSLVTMPSSNVTIPVSVSDASEATVDAATVTITPANWNKPENNFVTVTGKDDALTDGDVKYSFVTGNPSSSDTTYDNLASGDVRNVSLINSDNEPDQPLTGRWAKGKKDTISFKRGRQYNLNYGFDGHTDKVVAYGSYSDTPLAGDWNGDGRADLGFKRSNVYYLDYNRDGKADKHFSYGRASDTPIVGDWDGDGHDEIGLKRGNQYRLNYNNDSTANKVFRYGLSSDTPLAGDWNNTGRDKVAVKRDNMYRLNYGYDSKADRVFFFGASRDTPLAGDWDGDGRDEVGVKRDNTYRLTFDNNATSEVVYKYGR